MTEQNFFQDATAEILQCNRSSKFKLALVYLENGNLDCEAVFKDFLIEQKLVFGMYHLVRISVTWALFLFSCAGNFTVLCSVTLRRKSPKITHTQLIMLHLSLANLAFTFFILPMDAIWNYTLQWCGGDVLCRIMNLLKQFAMYISSAIIMVMGIDRVTNLLWPTSLSRQRQRIKRMLAAAWVVSFINSLPGAIMFSASRYNPLPCDCPDHYVVQCVDFMLIKELGVRKLFYLYSTCVSFFIPLLCIIVCYFIIAVRIAKMSKRAKATERSSSGFRPNNNSRKSLVRQSLHRARRVSQIVTGLITITFIVCWGPYYVVGAIHWFGGKRMTEMVEVVMLMSSYLNPCLHPIITVFLMRDVRQTVNCHISCPFKYIRRNKTHKSTETFLLKSKEEANLGI